MKIKLIILILFACLLVAMVPVRAESYHFDVTPAYVPVHILIYCTYSTNYTIPSVSSTNQSSFVMTQNVTGSTLVFAFSTGDVDVFNFGFTVYYPIAITQTVRYVVYQGSLNVQGGGQMSCTGDTFSMTFTVATSKEPAYPTPNDIVSALLNVAPTKQNFLQWASDLETGIATMSDNALWQWIIVAIDSILCFATVIVVFWKRPKETS